VRFVTISRKRGKIMDGRKGERKQRTKKFGSRGRKVDIEKRIKKMKSERDVTPYFFYKSADFTPFVSPKSRYILRNKFVLSSS
jgi:hypothetical protein